MLLFSSFSVGVLPLIISVVLSSVGVGVQIAGMVSTAHEVVVSVLSALTILRCRRLFGAGQWLRFLFLSFCAVAIGDLTYGLVTYIFRVPPPRFYLPLVHEIPYVFFAWLLAGAGYLRAVSNLRPSEKKIVQASITAITIVFFAISYSMVLHPFFTDHFRRPDIMYITSSLYAVGQSIAVASIFMCSLRTFNYSEFSLWLMFLFLMGSDFALRYQDLGNTVSMLPIFEYGWEFALGSIFIILRRPENMILSDEKTEIATIQSVRFISASLALVVLLMFVVVSSILTSYLRFNTGATIGTYVLGFVVIWSIANVGAILLSKSLIAKVDIISKGIVESVNLKMKMDSSFTVFELNSGFSALEKMKFLLAEALYKNIELETDARIGKLMAQVAHDIRSPIAALDVATMEASGLPEENRILIRSACTRIKDIANSLLRVRARRELVGKPEGFLTVEHVGILVESVVSEKRLQLKNTNIKIHFEIPSKSYGIFSLVEKIEFKRVISNLLDNGIEALNGEGYIQISMMLEGSEVTLDITDSGQGIKKEILKQLLEHGGSFGKNNGSGLGLLHAKESCKKWKGAISILKTGMTGTTVRLQIPSVDPPVWFCERIELGGIEHVIVVDDDSTAHKIWDARFGNFGKPLLHFTELTHFENDWKGRQMQSRNLSLIDFEFSNSNKNGLDLVRELGIANCSYLVTSHFENNEVRVQCFNSGIRMIPKSLVGIVPICKQSALEPRSF